MSTATASRGRSASREHYRLEVNSYDRASSLLVSLLVVAVITAIALAIIFFARQFVAAEAIFQIKPGPKAPPSEKPLGVADDIEPPGLEDAPELIEPKLMDTLNALTSKLSSKVAVIADPPMDASDAVGKGNGLGGRESGVGGGGPDRRREIEYEFADVATYARWYDFYKVELGVIDFQAGREFYYASNLSQAKPTVRTGPRNGEKRYFFPASESALFAFDQQLVQKAGISDKGNGYFQFFPDEAYSLLVARELAFAKSKGKSEDQIERTVFKVETKGSGFDITVKEQLYY